MNPEPPDPTDETEPGPIPLDEPALNAALDAGNPDLGRSLRALLDPPGDIERRTAHVVDRNLRGRSAGGLALDLLGLGWLTLTTILTGEGPRADGTPEGNDDEH